MEEKILDVEYEENDNRWQINRIFLISLVTIFLFYIIEYFRSSVPDNLSDYNGSQIKTMGLLIMVIVTINSIIIPNILNTLKPILNKWKIVIFTGLIIFSIEIVFKFTQNIFVSNNGLNLDYLELIKNVGMISGIGMLIANIRIHKLRKSQSQIPVLLLIGLIIIIGFLAKK
jgi:uncharacterized membrane protein